MVKFDFDCPSNQLSHSIRARDGHHRFLQIGWSDNYSFFVIDSSFPDRLITNAVDLTKDIRI